MGVESLESVDLEDIGKAPFPKLIEEEKKKDSPNSD